MANPSKRKGSSFEVAVVEFLRGNGFPNAERRVTRGAKDAGDVAGVPNWCLELKATRDIDIAGAVDEAAREAVNAGAKWYAAIIKRRQRGVDQSYVVMPLSLWGEFIDG